MGKNKYELVIEDAIEKSIKLNQHSIDVEERRRKELVDAALIADHQMDRRRNRKARQNAE